MLACTYFGGPNYDRAYAIEVDETGVYIAGRAGASLPVSGGAMQTVFNGDNNANPQYGQQDGFAAKFSLDLRTRLWCTYIGGPSREFCRDMAIDDDGNVYCAMAETTTGFPLISPGAFDTTYNGGVSDGAVVKINAAGTALVYGTLIGGSEYDGGTPSIRVNIAGEAYYLQLTDSVNAPVTSGVVQTIKGAGSDMHLSKLKASGSGLVFATYFGGNQGEFSETHGLALDAAGNPVLALTTRSTNLPTTAGALQRTYQGSGGSGTGANTNYAGDGFVVKLSSDGQQVFAATYLGGSLGDGIEGVSVDSNDNVYISGSTYSANFPVTPGCFQASRSGAADFFAVILSSDFTAEPYGSYIGGGAVDYGRSSIVDSAGNFIIVGMTASTNFPVLNPLQSTNRGGGNDGAFVRFATSAGPSEPLNLAPVVTAGADQTIIRPASASLSGSASDDGLPKPPATVSVLWSQVSGPGTATFGSANAAKTTATFSMEGTYVLRLTATDSVLSASDNVTVTVTTGPSPVAITPAQLDLDPVFSSFLGGSGDDSIRDVAVDAQGNFYLAGGTGSSNFPATSGSFDASFNGNHDAWIAKLTPTGQMIACTYFGGPGYDRAYAVKVDGTGVYIAGRAGVGFPTTTHYNEPSQGTMILMLRTALRMVLSRNSHWMVVHCYGLPILAGSAQKLFGTSQWTRAATFMQRLLMLAVVYGMLRLEHMTPPITAGSGTARSLRSALQGRQSFGVLISAGPG